MRTSRSQPRLCPTFIPLTMLKAIILAPLRPYRDLHRRVMQLFGFDERNSWKLVRYLLSVNHSSQVRLMSAHEHQARFILDPASTTVLLPDGETLFMVTMKRAAKARFWRRPPATLCQWSSSDYAAPSEPQNFRLHIANTIFFRIEDDGVDTKVRLRTQDKKMQMDRLCEWEEFEQLLNTRSRLRSPRTARLSITFYLLFSRF